MDITIYFGCCITLLGLLIGSFLNVCIYRIPLKESIIKGNSHCTQCNEKIKAYDLIPLFSFLFLRGKCRHCGAKISFRYPLIELLNCILYVIIFITCGMTLKTLLYCALASTLIVISMIDFDTQEIPNGLVIFLLCLSPIGFLINDIPFWHRLIGFVAASGILLILALLTNGFGGGDIKLMAACGLILGFKNILLALFIGTVLGGIIGVFLLIKHRKENPHEVSEMLHKQVSEIKTEDEEDDLPPGAKMSFGPYLAMGVMLAALYGEQIFNWYLNLLL